MATDQWAPRCNIALVHTVSELVKTVSHRRTIVWQHVFGHTGDPGNERADRLAKLGAAGHQQTWTRRRLTRTHWEPRPPNNPPEPENSDPPCPLPWDRFSTLLRETAVEVLGTTKQNNQPSFYSPADLDHIMSLMDKQQQCWKQVHQARGTPDEAALRTELQEAKKAVREFKQDCRNRWVTLIIQDLEDALRIHDLGRFYNLLPKLGIHVQGKSQAGRELFTLDAARTHFQSTMASPLPVEEDLISQLPSRPTAEWLGTVPSRQETEDALTQLRESAPGADQITTLMLRLSGELGLRVLTTLMQTLWTTPADQWHSSLHTGLGILLWKRKGQRSDVSTYRMIVLLSIGSRLLAKIIANRLRRHCEDLNLLPPFQWGFRPNRSTSDVLVILRILSELATEISQPADPLAIISFDIQRAYPSVPRDAAYQVFRKTFGLPDALISVISSLHNNTQFIIRTQQGDAEPFRSQKGFREGCPSSPALYNLYHTIPINHLVQEATSLQPPAGLDLGFISGKPLNKRTRKIPSKLHDQGLAHIYHMFILLFADDTTALTRASQASEVEALAAQVLRQWGETLHPDKTERLVLNGTTPPGFSESLNFLGIQFDNRGGVAYDTKHRLAKASQIWCKVYSQLPRLGISLKVQSQLVQATVFASLLYGCETRPYSRADLRTYQVFQNKITFGLTRQRRKTMQDQKLTLSDLRQSLHMPTIQTMIGKRKIDFLGHLARKPPESLERKVLFSYLIPENEQPAHKRGHTLRYQYWNLLEEIRKLADFESQNWSTKWPDLAAEADGITWRTLRKKWWQHQIKKDNEDTWAIRHAPGGARDQKLAKAQARAEAAYGATPGPNGLYTCPHCGVSMLLRSLKKHILPCKNLPDDQRALLQARRDHRAAKKPPPAAAAQAPHPADHNPAASQSRNRPNRLRRRLNGKQPAPSLRNPKRQMCAQDLPAPPPPRGWPPTKCNFCLQEFENKNKCVKHTCSCKKMPYKIWIARIKKVQEHVTVKDHPCPHCRIFFWTAHAKGRHSVVCLQRGKAEDLQ